MAHQPMRQHNIYKKNILIDMNKESLSALSIYDFVIFFYYYLEYVMLQHELQVTNLVCSPISMENVYNFF